MWPNMVHVKPPYLVDLEIESMKKIFWSINGMLKNVLANYYVLLLARDEFIAAMLCMRAANSSRKLRLLIKNAKIEKSDLTLSTHVHDFRCG